MTEEADLQSCETEDFPSLGLSLPKTAPSHFIAPS